MARTLSTRLLLALLFLSPLAAHAHLIDYLARYTLSYDYPPNPCNATSVGGNPLEGTTLEGVLALSALDPDGNPIPLASRGASGVSCGSQISGELNWSLDTGSMPASLRASFGGAILLPNPGPPDLPLFAFAQGTADPEIPSPGPPEIVLATLDAGGAILLPNPGPPELPLFAFASPGTRVGTLSIDILRVPEPSTVLLAGAGLIGLWAGRRRRAGNAGVPRSRAPAARAAKA